MEPLVVVKRGATGTGPNGNDLHQCQLRCDKTPASLPGR